jgi:hypothetical protein
LATALGYAAVQNLLMLLPVVALVGISWTVSASELWIAGQQSDAGCRIGLAGA